MSSLFRNKSSLDRVLSRIEKNMVSPRLKEFLVCYNSWKLPHQTIQYFDTNLAEMFNDPNSEYHVSTLFRLNTKELNILTKINPSLCGYLIFPYLQDLHYPQLVKMYIEWLFLFDDYCESIDNTPELQVGLQKVFAILTSISHDHNHNKSIINTILSQNQDDSDKFEWYGKLLIYILNQSFKLSNNNVKWNIHAIKLHKDYLISLLFEKVLLLNHLNGGQILNKQQFESIRFFSAATHIGLSYSQILNDNFICNLETSSESVFEKYLDIGSIFNYNSNQLLGIYHKYQQILNYMRCNGYHTSRYQAVCCFNAVRSVNLFNELIGFRRDVMDDVYPFNSVFANCNDGELLSFGYRTTFDSFHAVNRDLDEFKDTYVIGKNLASFVYGINLWQFFTSRYKMTQHR